VISFDALNHRREAKPIVPPPVQLRGGFRNPACEGGIWRSYKAQVKRLARRRNRKIAAQYAAEKIAKEGV